MGYSNIIVECCGEFSQTFNINFNNMSFTGEYNNLIDQIATDNGLVKTEHRSIVFFSKIDFFEF